jgi:glycerol-3-phosphate dehydrogenase
MWQRQHWRDELWADLARPWDIIIIGGGITGAGIFQQVARLGLCVLLVEQRDFAWGTSSRSSKFVHGGLRYLAEGDLRLTRESVHERQKLLQAAPGLVNDVGFLIALYRGARPRPIVYKLALSVYDRLGTQRKHQRFGALDFLMLAPHVVTEGLQGGYRYDEAQTDDSRLTLRVLHEGIAAGGAAINYVTAAGLICEGDEVKGVHLHDNIGQRTAEARARVVINATGAWADALRGEVNAEPRIRPLRGSHLAFPGWRFPVAQAIAFSHPFDHRPVSVCPWENVTVIGTTDVDHHAPLNDEPAISPQETAYLMAAVQDRFPALGLTLDDVISTWSGVRPVINTGKGDPSKESRDHAVWDERGLLTVTGGKLTTFRKMALDALKAVQHRLPALSAVDTAAPPLQPVNLGTPLPLPKLASHRLLGRYAEHTFALVEAAQPGELDAIPGTFTLWAELRWAARSEAVVHLSDLLLRRTRLGLLLPAGGESILPQVRAICQPELGWDDSRWEAEAADYLALWKAHYSLPPRDLIPDWQDELAKKKQSKVTKRGS